MGRGVAGRQLGRGREAGGLGGEVGVGQVDLVPGRQGDAVEMEIEMRRGVGAAVAGRVPVQLHELVGGAVVGRELEQVLAVGAVVAGAVVG